jgi:hypothetical protein
MQPGIWTNTEALIIEWDTCPLQVLGIVEASTSQKRNWHHVRLELSKLTQDGNNIRFLQLHLHVAELHTSHKLHKNIFRLCSVVPRRRVIVNLRNGQPRGTEETHCGHFTSDSIVLGDCDWVRDADYNLKAAMHGGKESPVEAALSELHKCVDILRTPTNRQHRKSTKLIDVKLTSALSKAKIIVDTECARLQIRCICQRTTWIGLAASILMDSWRDHQEVWHDGEFTMWQMPTGLSEVRDWGKICWMQQGERMVQRLRDWPW